MFSQSVYLSVCIWHDQSVRVQRGLGPLLCVCGCLSVLWLKAVLKVKVWEVCDATAGGKLSPPSFYSV